MLVAFDYIIKMAHKMKHFNDNHEESINQLHSETKSNQLFNFKTEFI